MTTHITPFLCGGTFFAQLVRAKKTHTSPTDHINGQKESLSEPELFRRLISIFQRKDFINAGNTLKTNASNFKRCINSTSNYIGFSDFDLRKDFDADIKSNHSKAFIMTAHLITDFIDESRYEQLSRCLLGLIQEDSTIDANTSFYLGTHQIEKGTLITLEHINLPSLVLGIWHFIAMNRRDNNKEGATTYNSWYPTERNAYKGDIGKHICQSIHVECTIPSNDIDTPSSKNESQKNSNDSCKSESENPTIQTQIIQNATIVNQYGDKNIKIEHVDTLYI